LKWTLRVLDVINEGKAEVKIRVKNIDMAEFNGLSNIEVYGIVTPSGEDMIEM
jgi:hypothetical protein